MESAKENKILKEERYKSYTDLAYGNKKLNHQQAKLLSDIKVPINVEIGGVVISAEDIINFSSEQVLNFNFNPTSEVSLRVGSEVIAYGQLVICDGSLAVKITSTDVSCEDGFSSKENKNEEKEEEDTLPFHEGYKTI